MKDRLGRAARMSFGIFVCVSCGDGNYGGFESLTGNWRITAQSNVATSGCAIQPDGLNVILLVEQSGDLVSAYGPPEPPGYWTGRATDDGFEISHQGDFQCADGSIGRENLRLTITGIDDPASDAYGNAAYSFEAACGDGSPPCLLRSNGDTKHTSN